MTGEEIQAFFAAHGEVPQTLEFHIGDVAKRHGTLRSGPASNTTAGFNQKSINCAAS